MPAVEEIDLLVIDGPPALERAIEMARERALDLFWDRPAPSATVLVDDVDRRGEMRVLAAWRKRHPIEFIHQRGGYALARLPRTGNDALASADMTGTLELFESLEEK